MEFYANKDRRNREMVYLYLSEIEAQHLGENGTRLGLSKTENGSYLLRPDPNARSRLHRNKQSGDWQISTTKVPGFPVTGRTVLVNTRVPNGFVLKPHESNLQEINLDLSVAHRNVGEVERQKLPLNIPPKEEELKKRAKVGAPATIEDLKTALELLNDVLARLDKSAKVLIHTEAGEDRRVRATVTTRTEL